MIVLYSLIQYVWNVEPIMFYIFINSQGSLESFDLYLFHMNFVTTDVETTANYKQTCELAGFYSEKWFLQHRRTIVSPHYENYYSDIRIEGVKFPVPCNWRCKSNHRKSTWAIPERDARMAMLLILRFLVV